MGENQWPDEDILPGFRASYLRYYAELLELSRALMRIFALALDLEEDFFDAMTEFPGATSRMLHYPPQPVEGQEIPGLAAHTVCISQFNNFPSGRCERNAEQSPIAVGL